VKYIEGAAEAKGAVLPVHGLTAPHWPLHARPQDIERYRGRYESGWDALREERRRKQIELGIVDSALANDNARPPCPQPWTEATDKEWQERRMEVYAAMVDSMDQGVGRIRRRASAYRDRNRTPSFCSWPTMAAALRSWDLKRRDSISRRERMTAAVRVGNIPGVMPGPEDTYQSYGIPWANASNTPFRLYKHWVHEGGISSPLIAYWPGRRRLAR
jgi:arylsulfatase